MRNPHSNNISERKAYADFLKLAIKVSHDALELTPLPYMMFSPTIAQYEKQVNEEIQKDVSELQRMQKKYIAKLKDKLANYDVYNQKTPYRCPICHERECICQELQLNVSEPQNEDDTFKQQILDIFK
jgi:hypothetical protein